MSKLLKEKVAIVTGASKGIGASIAKHLAAEGASVVVNYSSSKDDADKVVAEITHNGGKAIAVKADVTSQNDIKHLFDESLKVFGKLDILVNNAGIYQFVPLEEVTKEFINKIFDINVVGLLLTSQEAVKHFGPSGGSIINISSIASVSVGPNVSVYSASKAAVDAITKGLSKELGPRKIRVNSINPGMVETEGLHASGLAEGDYRIQIEAQIPLGRIGQPTDIAPAAVFLASDQSSWLTGTSIFITGGLY